MVDRLIEMRGDESRYRDQERHLQRAAIPGTFSGPAGFSGRADDRGHGADRRRIVRRGQCHRQAEGRLLPDHRQGQVPQDRRARRRDRISHEQESRRRNMWWYRGEAKVGGTLVAEAEVGAMLVRGLTGVLAIDPTARIAPSAVMGANVEIGPYCVIGPDVTVGDNCKLVAHVHLAGHTTIGPDCTIYPFASLGTPPQSVHYRGGPTQLVLGATCQIRESVTINTGTEDGGGITTRRRRLLPDDWRSCRARLPRRQQGRCSPTARCSAGMCEVGDHVFLGGHCAVHQRTRIGESVMVAGYTAAERGRHPVSASCCIAIGRLVGLNIVGMRRRGIREARHPRRAASLSRRCLTAKASSPSRVDRTAAEFGSIPRSRGSWRSCAASTGARCS